jgi:transketolase
MDMVSQAGGLALNGHLPVVHSFGCFLTPRANEQIYNNATESTKIIYAGSLVGLVPGGPGHSHQSVRDFGILSQIPGMVCIEPCCERETASALEWAIHANPLSTYLRLVTIPVDIPLMTRGNSRSWGKASPCWKERMWWSSGMDRYSCPRLGRR